MNRNTKLLRWFYLLALTGVLSGTSILSHAQSLIVYNFTNNLQGWSGNNDNAIYTWNATGGSTGGGCMQVQFGLPGTNEIDPWVTLPATLNEAQYLSVSVHMMVDSSSGTTGTAGSGGYGNLQAVFRNASYSWDSMWYGTVYPGTANSWVTYTFVIPQPYHPAEKFLQFQFQGNSGTGYTAPVTVYIDNVTITPLPNPWVIDPFITDTSSGYSEEGWTGSPEVSSLNTSQDSGGGFTPAGALEMDINWPAAAQWAAWGQSWVLRAQAMDPSRYSFFECDVKVDAANSTLMSDGSYGGLVIALRDTQSYSGPYACSPSSTKLDSSFTSWKHLKLALPTAGAGGNAITNSPAYDIELSGNYMGPVRLYFDNITLSKPVNHPLIAGLKTADPGGLKIAVDADGTANQYDQEGFSAPSADCTGKNFFWINQTPATYSFTLTNFPAPAVAPGFDAHVYLINGSTIESGPNDWNYNQTYSGVPYNALDYAGMRVQNGTNGGVAIIFEWKTNSINSNPSSNNVTRFNLPSLPSVNGTWSLNFSDNTHLTITGPGGTVENLTLPDFYNDPNYAANFTPSDSLVQFGVAKNDAQNTGVNNSQSAIFTQVLVSNSPMGTIYNDTFNAGLTGNYSWQVATYYLDAADRITWSPYGTAKWLQWGLPATGYTVRSAPSLTGPWSDAGITYTYTDATGTNIFGAIPAANLPAGNAAFFQLVNTNSP